MNAEEYVAITLFPTNFLSFQEKKSTKNRIMHMHSAFINDLKKFTFAS